MQERIHQLGAGIWLLGPLAVCFSSICLVAHATGRTVSPPGATLFAAGVIAAYALDYWADHREQYLPRVLGLAVLATVAGLSTVYWLPFWKIVLAGVLGIFGLSYRRWKKLPLGKTILIAGSWTTASLCFPVQGITLKVLLSPLGGVLAALFAAAAILCDMKDSEADARAGVGSAVVLWGCPTAIGLAVLLAGAGFLSALAIGRLGLAGAGLALALLAAFPQTLSRPVLGPALVDGALTLPVVIILARLG
jgi:4-hydroxybenzoate polyprenyltransferase